jgi:hypothetical protein
MIAPARVPQVITVESCHQRSALPPRSGTMRYERRYVRTTETIEVSHTSWVKGVSKLIRSAPA